MNTYLFAWNPKDWPLEKLHKTIKELNETGSTSEPWTCSNSSTNVGDRFFLIALGNTSRGLIGSGFIASNRFSAPHRIVPNKFDFKVRLNFDYLKEPLAPTITQNYLISNLDIPTHWSPRSSGILIKDNVANNLETIWFELTNQNISFKESTDTNNLKLTEGRFIKTLSTKYERNPEARRLCIEHYGPLCTVCEINFEKKYGAIGKDFIHVHHLERVSDRKGIYQIDPIKDLRPVCPNCHSIIHKKEPPFSIEEMKELIADSPKF